jgi:class 3 adenylate cyclase/tetratricopeptide (TPR) repeat protein
MNCASCLLPVPADARFCPHCGTAVAAPVAPRELRKTVTVLFCDMADSTALSGRLDPESLREVMVRYFALMRECLERHGGTVEKFIGDAVVAVFGVPLLHEDDAPRALSAAAEMVSAMDSLNEELRRLIGVEIGIRVGVNTGEVVVAADATSGQVLASGEAMNIAARLQQHAAPGQVILGPETRMLAERDGVFASVGDLTLKGVAQPVPAWRLVRLRSAAASRAGYAGRPFIGRESEMSRLERLLRRSVDEGSCGVVMLHGEPGVGKSRLAAEFAALAADGDALIGIARCQPYGEGTPVRALGEALGQIVVAALDRGLVGAGTEAEARPDFAEALGYLRASLLRDGSPGDQPGQLAWAVTEVLQGIAHQQPVLLVLDEFHAGKPFLAYLISQVASRVSEGAVLIVCVGRSEEESPPWGAGIPGAIPLHLGPMGTDDARLMIAGLNELVPHHASLTEQIVERAGGNPFFIEQLADIASHAGTDTLPPTVRSVIGARLDLLRPREHDVLLRAAVPGVRFSVPELSVLLVADPAVSEPPDQALGALASRHLIMAERPADTYRFSGMLIREVAYSTLSKRARLRYHEALATWYQDQPHASDQTGLHLGRAYRLAAELRPADPTVARLRAAAAAALTTAGTIALRGSDLHWAGDLLAQAIELHDEDSREWVAVGVKLAEARLLLGTDPHAPQTLTDLAAQASESGDRLTAAHACLLLAALELPGPSAVADAMATVPLFEAAGDELGLSRAWLRVAQLRQLGGRYEEAEDLLRRALRHALRSGAELELAGVIGGLATSLWRGPVPVDAAVAGCQRLISEHGAGRRAVRATVNCPHAVLLAYQGEHEAARELVRASIRIISELGHAYGAAAMAIFAATVEGLAGRWEVAGELLSDAIEASRVHGDVRMHGTATAGLARALLEQGKDGPAGDLADAIALTGDPFLDAETNGVQARALARRGDASQALLQIELARGAAAATDSTACQATAELDRAHVLRSLGDPAAAMAAATSAGRLFRAKGHQVGVNSIVAFGESLRDPSLHDPSLHDPDGHR